MPRGEKSVDADQQKRKPAANGKRAEQKEAARPAAESRAWAAANKLHSGGNKMAARRKLPSGPLGGSGRKTNLARSS